MCYRVFTFLLLCFLACATMSVAQVTKQPELRKSTDKPTRGTLQLPGQTPPPVDAENKIAPNTTAPTAPPTVKDSTEKPERVDSYVFNDDVVKNRIFVYQVDRYLNMPTIGKVDTLIADRFRDIIYRKDVGATFLGVSGSAAVTYNYFLRKTHDYMYPLTPFNAYFTTPDNILFYNTRTPFTRFTYSGNPFANRQFEELNIEALHSQNITPEWNAGVMYRHYGGRGLMANEATDNRMFTLFTSYSGKRYFAQAGYIYNGSHNRLNGGMTDDAFVLDTVMDVRTIPVNLASANDVIKTNTFFVTQSLGIPLHFLRKKEVADTLRTGEGTIVYLGNSLEYTTAERIYKDNIALTDSVGRAYYNNQFYIDPTTSNDSIHSTLFDARVFMTLQPFTADFIISKIGGGIGYRYLSNYAFQQSFYLRPAHNNSQHNLFLYANASGNFKQYFSWSGFVRYYLSGYNQNDLFVNGNATISLYPIEQGIHLWGKFTIDSRMPDSYLQNYYSNHVQWNNHFGKTTETKIQAGINIPLWQLNVSVGQSVLNAPVFFNANALPEQSDELVSILSASIEKNFRAWLVHFDNRLLIQYSSHQNIVPLPLVALNSSIYLETEVVKNVLTAQIGGDIYFNTKFHAYNYHPAAGAFYTQNAREIGNYPNIDAFINLKWKQATLFIKMVNVGQGWPDRGYFSALHYVKPERTLKLGISWPFYL